MRTGLSVLIIFLINGILAGPDNFGRKFKVIVPDGQVTLLFKSKHGQAAVTLKSNGRNLVVNVSNNKTEKEIFNGTEKYVDITSNKDISVIMEYGKCRSVIPPLYVMQNADTYLLPKLSENDLVTADVASMGDAVEISLGEEKKNIEKNGQISHILTADSILKSSAMATVFLRTFGLRNNTVGLNLLPVSLMGTRFLLNEDDGGEANVMASANIDCTKNGEDLSLVKGESQKIEISGLELLECRFSESGEKAGVQVIQVKNDTISLAVPTVQYGLEHPVSLDSDDKVEITTRWREGLENDTVINPDGLTKEGTEIRKNGFVVLKYSGTPGDYKITSKNPTSRMNVRVISSDHSSVPSSSAFTQTGEFCRNSVGTANDGLDNDCDGWVDEELHNYKDTDSDGLKDEDIAENELYPAVYPDWMLSWTVLILVFLFFLLLILIAVCHWQCSKCEPKIDAPDDRLMVASYDSRMINYRYSMSGSVNGFTLSRR